MNERCDGNQLNRKHSIFSNIKIVGTNSQIHSILHICDNRTGQRFWLFPKLIRFIATIYKIGFSVLALSHWVLRRQMKMTILTTTTSSTKSVIYKIIIIGFRYHPINCLFGMISFWELFDHFSYFWAMNWLQRLLQFSLISLLYNTMQFSPLIFTTWGDLLFRRICFSNDLFAYHPSWKNKISTYSPYYR